MHALFVAFISSLLLEHALFLLVLARSDHGIPDGGLQVWLHGRMLCYASCVLCLEAPQRAQGLLASKTKRPISPIYSLVAPKGEMQWRFLGKENLLS